MSSNDDVSRFVAGRDPQRVLGARVLTAPAHDSAAPSALPTRIAAARSRDPELSAFLQSGFARLVVPVRPGFGTVIESGLNLDRSEPFETTPPTTTSSDTSVSIAEELWAAQALAGGGPAREPWLVNLPTTKLAVLDGMALPWHTPSEPNPRPGPRPGPRREVAGRA